MPAFQRRKLRGWGWRGTSHERSTCAGKPSGNQFAASPDSAPCSGLQEKKKKKKTKGSSRPDAGRSPLEGAACWQSPGCRRPSAASWWAAGAGRCALGDISWPGARAARRRQERAGGRGRAPGAGRLARWEPVCLAGPPHLGSICVSLEPDRRLQAVRKRRCEGPDTCPANERRRKAGLSLRSRIKSGGGRKSPFYLYCEETRCVHQQLDRANLAA